MTFPCWAYNPAQGLASGRVFVSARDLVLEHHEATGIRYEEDNGGMYGDLPGGRVRLTRCRNEKDGWVYLAQQVREQFCGAEIDSLASLRRLECEMVAEGDALAVRLSQVRLALADLERAVADLEVSG